MENKITVKHILWYFIIFSIIGLIIETLFCYITTGVLESRRGFIWGPLCPVYGFGATILILLLNSYQKNGFKLFIVGCILGNVIEYMLSYALEAMYGTRFWDYSYLNYSLNGRICFTYSIFWGILSVLLIKVVKNPIDKIIEKIPNRKLLQNSIIGLLAIDGICTIWAINSYQGRIANQGQNKNQTIITKIENTLFSNEKMEKTFPNLRYIDEEGKEHYIKDILKDN